MSIPQAHNPPNQPGIVISCLGGRRPESARHSEDRMRQVELGTAQLCCVKRCYGDRGGCVGKDWQKAHYFHILFLSHSHADISVCGSHLGPVCFSLSGTQVLHMTRLAELCVGALG